MVYCAVYLYTTIYICYLIFFFFYYPYLPVLAAAPDISNTYFYPHHSYFSTKNIDYLYSKPPMFSLLVCAVFLIDPHIFL